MSCVICKKPTPNNRKTCSRECLEKRREQVRKDNYNWLLDKGSYQDFDSKREKKYMQAVIDGDILQVEV